MNSTARDDLPDDPRELAKLAGLLGYSSAEALLADCQRYTAENPPPLRAAVRGRGGVRRPGGLLAPPPRVC